MPLLPMLPDCRVFDLTFTSEKNDAETMSKMSLDSRKPFQSTTNTTISQGRGKQRRTYIPIVTSSLTKQKIAVQQKILLGQSRQTFLEISMDSQEKKMTSLASMNSSSLISVSSEPLFAKREETNSFFGLNKLTQLCGFNEKTNKNGCNCNKPCQSRLTWTNNSRQVDLRLYKKLLFEPISPANQQQIARDVARTHMENPSFSQNELFREMLRQVLTAYCIYDKEVGYVQGINLIAGTLLYHIANSSETFWVLVEMMEEHQLRLIYLEGFSELRNHVGRMKTLIRSKIPQLHQHMRSLQIELECLVFGWMLTLMNNCVPLEYSHEILGQFKKYGWKFIDCLILAYLQFMQEYLLMVSDQADFLCTLNHDNSKQLGAEWVSMIATANKLMISL